MSVKTRGSWLVAVIALILLFVAFGSIYIVVVALKEMALEYGKRYPQSVSHVIMIGIAPDLGPENTRAMPESTPLVSASGTPTTKSP